MQKCGLVLNGGEDSDSDSGAGSGNEDSSTEEESEEEVSDTEVINKEFMGATPTDSDIEGMEALLKQLLKHWNVDLKELAKILVQQNYATTLMKAAPEEGPLEPDEEDDDTVYGVYGVINLKTHKDNPAIEGLLEHILGSEGIIDSILGPEALSSIQPGFLIKEKIINIPGIATAPFLHQLRNDMRESSLKGMPYDFTHFLHVAKVVELEGGRGNYFVEQDDEIFEKNNLSWFDMHYGPLEGSEVVFEGQSHGAMITGKQFRRIYIFSEEHMQTYMTELGKIDAVHNVMAEAHSSGLKH